MANKTSENVLASATGLLGFNFVVITSLHLASATQNSVIDEMTSIVSVMLIFSCIGAFIGIRTDNKSRFPYAKVADYLFILSLLGELAIILLVTFNYLPV